MALDVPKLIDDVERAMRGLWQGGGGGGAGPATVAGPTTLAFEPVGLTQPRSLFTPDGSQAFGPATPVIAAERTARMADEILRLVADDADGDASHCERLNRRASVLFREVANAARADPTWSPDRVADFEAAKARVLRAIQASRVASSLTMLDEYLAVRATPTNWYDPGATDIWSRFSFDVRDAPPTPGLVAGPARPPGWMFRVARPTPEGLVGDTAGNGFAVSPALLAHPPSFFFNEQLADVHPAQPAAPVAVPPPAPAGGAAPATEFVAASSLFNAKTIDLLSQSRLVEPEADSITLSFSACVVTIERPWLDWSFWEGPGWHVPGAMAGAVAPAQWPTVNVGMVVAKDLLINLDKPPDVNALQLALTFGPFNLMGRDYRAISGFAGWEVFLSVPGVQVIGWAIQPVSALPPAGDPTPR